MFSYGTYRRCPHVLCRSSVKCSIVDHINNREMPEGGLHDLQEMVIRDLPWAEGLPSTLLDKETHRRQVSILVSGMYVLAPQGRIEALTTLTLVVAQQQLQASGNCAMSNTFKTYDKYGYQPISLPNELHAALTTYLHLRLRMHVETPAFFVDYEGIAYDSTKLGHLVTQYFKTTMDLHLTTTMIRSLWEIMADKAFKANAINAEQRSAIMNINGHTSQTTRDYYLRDAREQDARHGVEVRDAIIAHDVQLLGAADRRAAISVYYAWGTEHPCYGVNDERAKWTDFEKDFVVNWCKAVVTANPEVDYKVVSMCLANIKADPRLVAQFHQRHTLDGSRLSYPWKEWKKDQRRARTLVNAQATALI